MLTPPKRQLRPRGCSLVYAAPLGIIRVHGKCARPDTNPTTPKRPAISMLDPSREPGDLRHERPQKRAASTSDRFRTERDATRVETLGACYLSG